MRSTDYLFVEVIDFLKVHSYVILIVILYYGLTYFSHLCCETRVGFFVIMKRVGKSPHHIVVFNSGYKLIVIVSTFLTKK